MASTPKGYPYPVGTDRVADGDDAIKSLAEFVDVRLGLAASGFFTSAAAASSGAVVATAITFPVGLFTVPPVVTMTAYATNPETANVSFGSMPTTTGFSARTQRPGSTAVLGCSWIAIQN